MTADRVLIVTLDWIGEAQGGRERVWAVGWGSTVGMGFERRCLV